LFCGFLNHQASSLNWMFNVPPRSPPSTAATYRAWTCHGTTNRELINNLYTAKIIKSKEVRDAMLSVDRKNYVSPVHLESSYDDTPLSIGFGQTISAPHMHAHALEELYPVIKNADPESPVKVLDVGCGSGYLSVSFGRLLSLIGRTVGDGSRVYGIDCVPQLVQLATSNIMKEDGALLSTGMVALKLADGWKGLPGYGPFQAIHVGAGAESLPKGLAVQLAPGGRMVIPVETGMGYQSLFRVDRVSGEPGEEYSDDHFNIQELFPVRYVPLVHP